MFFRRLLLCAALLFSVSLPTSAQKVWKWSILGGTTVTPAFVASVGWKGQNPSDPSTNINDAGANFIIMQVVIYDQTSGATPAPTDALTGCASPCNTWHLILKNPTSLTGNAGQFTFIAWNATTGAGHNFSCGCAAAQFQSNYVMSFSGVFAGGTPLDQINSTWNGSGASALTQQPGSVTPTTGNQLVVTGEGDFNNTGTGATKTVSAGYTTNLLQNAPVLGTTQGAGLAYNVQGATPAATNPTWTLSSTTNQFDFITSVFTFKHQ